MSKRRRTSSTQFPSKRNKREPSPDADSGTDTPALAPSSVAGSVYSERKLGLPTLTTLTIKSFTNDLLRLTTPHEKSTETIESLKALPEHLLLRVESALVEAWPQQLKHEFISPVFLHPNARVVKLPGTLIGVKKQTIQAVGSLRGTLRHLEITSHKFTDAVFASTLSFLPMLEHLNLRDCRLVGALSCKAIVKMHESLNHLNLSGTAATLADIKPILSRARGLEVLKLASLEGLTDVTVSRLIEDLYADELFEPLPSSPLAKLRTLKLRHTSITGSMLAQLLPHLPLLEKLDISFAPIGPMPFNPDIPAPPLTKLSLTSTPIDAKQLIPVLDKLPNLKILNIGALGASAKTAGGFAIGGGSSTAMGSSTLNDAVLFDLTSSLRQVTTLESVSLAGNLSLGKGQGRSMPYFIRQVGRRLKYLNLGGLSNLRSSDLENLLPGEEDEATPCLLERLVLMGCNIDDEAAVYISACSSLTFLDVENTKLSSEGLLDIIDACPLLETLNLTSCRRVKVTDRRRFFEVWSAERQHDDTEDESE